MQNRTLPDQPAIEPAVKARSTGRRLWPFALLAFGILAALSLAAWYLFTARDLTTNYFVIVTMPSGAEVEFDGTSLGPSPVLLDRVRVGTHRVRISREGFITMDEDVQVEVEREGPARFILKPVAPEGSVARSPSEQIEEFRRLAGKAFDRGVLVEPYLESALYYADAILAIDSSDGDAAKLRAGIRERLLANGRMALERREYSRAKVLYQQLLDAFPGDPEGTAGLEAARDPSRRPSPRPSRP